MPQLKTPIDKYLCFVKIIIDVKIKRFDIVRSIVAFNLPLSGGRIFFRKIYYCIMAFEKYFY